jgi:spermidine synthase
MSFAWFLSFSVGFLSLSQEILWVRIMSFAQGGTPVAFAFVLTLYLVGIAIGAAIGKRICAGATNLYSASAIVLLLAALTDPLPPLLGPFIANRGNGFDLLQLFLPVVCITATAAIKSVLFPIAHHLGSTQAGPNVGSSVSRVYFGNIMGSTLGPIVTGYFLLDFFTVDKSCLIIAALSLLLALLCAARAARRIAPFAGGAAVVALSWTLVATHSAFVSTAARTWMYTGETPDRTGTISHQIENKHGVVHTVSLPSRSDDVVYGGNMFDGRINVDLHHDTNGIARVYLIAALHPKPARVLVIGLSGGAWTKVLSGFEGVERIDAIDINSGYVELIAQYPQLASILTDPRVHVQIDDGRRWLRRHPGERFDLIVMNATIHYRAYSTNLLSREFMEEARSHLNEGGIFAFNTTGSKDAARTANEVFPFAVHHGTFIYAGERNFVPKMELGKYRLEQIRQDGAALFSQADFEAGGTGGRLLAKATGLKPVSELVQREGGDIITDANMLPEYRHGQRLDIPPLSWLLPSR